MSAIMALSIFISSTITPLAASKAYASDQVDNIPSIIEEESNEENNEELPIDSTNSELAKPDIKESKDNGEQETMSDSKEKEPEVKTEEAQEVEEKKDVINTEEHGKIINKSLSANLYEDGSYKALSDADIDIKITGPMPESSYIKAYKLKNPINDPKEENVLAFGFEIFYGDDTKYDKKDSDVYKIEIKSSELKDINSIFLYDKNKKGKKFKARDDFIKQANLIRLESKVNEFAITKEIKVNEEKLDPKEESETKNKQVSSIVKEVESLDKGNSLEEKESVDKTKELLENFTKKETTSNKKEDEKSDLIIESLRKEFIASKNDKYKDKVYAEKPSDTNNANVENTNKLSYQQLLAEIYTDQSYTDKTNDNTKIKVSGQLPANTKVKAYPVEIKIDGKEVLAAYDITIFDQDGNEYKTDEKNNIKVQISNPKIDKAENIEVYHKKDEISQEEKVNLEDKTNDTVTFDADSFSIYAVTEPEARTITFIFLNRDSKGDRNVWDVQKVRDGEKLIQPELPIFSYKGKFEGWHYYDYDSPNKEEKDRFGAKFDFDKPVEVNENSPKVIYLKGLYPDVVYVNFIDRKAYKKSDGSTGYKNEVLTINEVNFGEKIKTDNVPVLPEESGTVFSHWSTKPDGPPFDFSKQINKDTVKELRGNANYIELDLYAVYKKAYTVTFDSQGGTHVNKQIVYSGDKIQFSDLTKPVKPGYEFKYWSTTKSGSQFSEATPITKDTTLYAVYTPLNVKYTINYWLENADDDGYSLNQSKTKTANAGTLTNKDSSTYKLSSSIQEKEGMVYDHADSQKVIRGDGGTEINLYYKRQRFKYKIFTGLRPFIHYIVNEDVKWGADTTPYYNRAKQILGDGVSFKEDSVLGQMVTYPVRMPKEHYTLRAWNDGKNEWNVRIIDLETNDLIRLDQQTSHLDSESQGYTGGELISGYTFQYVESTGNKFARPRKVHPNGGTSELPEVWVYYTRNKHTLTFSSNGSGNDITRSNVPYDDNLEKYVPDNYIIGQTKNSDGKIFAGWYDNSSGSGKSIDFSKMTMPDNDIKVYAKWENPTYTVTAYKQRNNPNAGIIEQKVKEGDTVDKSKLSADKPPIAQKTPGSELRWYAYINGAITEYNFSEPVTSDIYLYPVWVAPEGNELRPLSQIYKVRYKAPTADGGYAEYSDPFEYVNNAEAIVLPPYIDGKYQFPDGKTIAMPKDQVFQGWVIDPNSTYTTVKDQTMLKRVYQPGDIVNVIGNIMFVPLLNEYDITTLTLKETGPDGTKLDDVVYSTREHDLNLPPDIYDNRGDEDLRKNDIVTLPDPQAKNAGWHKFLGWSTTEDGKNGKIFKPGEKVLLTNENLPNVLYGVWEKGHTITIKNQVDQSLNSQDDLKFELSYMLGDKNYKEEYTIPSNGNKDIEVPLEASNIQIKSQSKNRVQFTYKEQTIEGNTLTIGSIDSDIKVVVKTEPLPVPTGIIDDIAPMALMLALASMAFAYRLYKKIKLAGGIDG
ncbi:hypothetical protein DXA39_06270 [Anaerococcus nagyae]|uniref:Repeat protein n=2 Tax=Anaerococcus nagyae TaxID=1755241 RepID=A0A3E2TIY9_9FIRM|nr:hypothetical protein DXA39_06270 [Anaerococcus nagyae]